jgi:hypothetical protein
MNFKWVSSALEMTDYFTVSVKVVEAVIEVFTESVPVRVRV